MKLLKLKLFTGIALTYLFNPSMYIVNLWFCKKCFLLLFFSVIMGTKVAQKRDNKKRIYLINQYRKYMAIISYGWPVYLAHVCE